MLNEWTVTLRIDTSAWSANREYPMTNPIGVGHAWLTVASPSGERVDIGYYPDHTSTLAPGSLHIGDISHQPTQDAAYTYVITPGQAAQILDAAGRVQAAPGEYNVFSHNCLTVAHDLMTAGGVPLPPIEAVGAGLASATAWKTGEPVPPLHDPAVYSGLLRSTPDGQSARALYDRSASELSGNATGLLDSLRESAAAALHGDQAAPDPQQSAPVYLGEVDDPLFLNPQSATASYIELDDPQQSLPQQGTDTHAAGGDIAYSDTADAGLTHPAF